MIIFIKKSFLSSPTINDLIDVWGIYLILKVQEGAFNREEKLLFFVAMVAEFLDNSPKMSTVPLFFSFLPSPPPPPVRAIIPDARPLGTFENQDTRDGKTWYI